MIENLPVKFPKERLGNFYIGNIEPNNDRILKQSLCKTTHFDQIIESEKSLIIGSQGTGKSTLFKLVSEKKSFKNNGHGECHVIPIDERFQYSVLHEKVKKIIEANIDSDRFRFHIIWEFLIFFRILKYLSDKNLLPSSLKKIYTKLIKVIAGKTDLLDIISSLKGTLGIKLEETNNLLFPSFFVNAEQKDDVANKRVTKHLEQLNLDLDDNKILLQKYLETKNVNLIVALDRLDEFVNVSDESLQLEALAALVEVENGYSKFHNIRVVLFLRDDLFKKISYQPIGFNKIASKCLYLNWSREHIYELIARRLIYNYAELFKLSRLEFTGELRVRTHRQSRKQLMKDDWERLVESASERISKLFAYQNNSPKPKYTDVNDRISSELIISFFPRLISLNGTESIDLLDFLIDYFSLANKNLIPRFYIIYLEILVNKVVKFYKYNPDMVDSNYNHSIGQFLSVPNDMIVDSYNEFRTQIFQHFQESHLNYKKALATVVNSGSSRLKYEELSSLLKLGKDETENFCEYFIHLGVFKRDTVDGFDYVELPIMFQNLSLN